LLKWLIGITGAAVTLAIGVSVYVALFDVNQYKDELIEIIEAGTGRTFAIHGDIGLRLSLVPTIAVDGVAFGNPTWAVNENMVTVERIEAQLAVMPLLRAELVLKRLAIVGGRISIEKNRKGQGNWILDIEGNNEATGSSSTFPRIDLDELEIRRTIIEYRAGTDVLREVAVDQLTLTSEGFDQPLTLGLTAAYKDIPVQVHGRISRIRRLLGNEPYAVDLSGTSGDIHFSVKGEVEKPLQARGMKLTVTLGAPQLATLAAPLDLDLSERGPVDFKASLSDLNEGYSLTDLQLRVANSEIAARGALEPVSGQWHIEGAIDARKLDPGDFVGPPSSPDTADRLFSDVPLPLDWLRSVEGRLDVAFGSVVGTVLPITDLTAQVTIDDGVLEITPIAAKVGDGALNATIEIDTRKELPDTKITLKITQMSLGSLPKLGQGGTVSRGSTDLSFSLAGSGRSVAAIMASGNGFLAVDVGPATINNTAAGIVGSDLVLSLFNHLNPLSAADPTTVLECAAVRFPIAQGVARNRTGIGVQTRKLSILGGGTVNLQTEAIDIGAKPKPREGLGLNLSSLVDFVRLGGTLAKPRVLTDAKGAATAGLKVGAAFATAGLSILAEGLFDRTTANGDVCATARGKKVGDPETGRTQKDPALMESTTSKTKAVMEDAGAKIKGVFKGLFGN